MREARHAVLVLEGDRKTRALHYSAHGIELGHISGLAVLFSTTITARKNSSLEDATLFP
jgi:hypothetical protein